MSPVRNVILTGLYGVAAILDICGIAMTARKPRRIDAGVVGDPEPTRWQLDGGMWLLQGGLLVAVLTSVASIWWGGWSSGLQTVGVEAPIALLPGHNHSFVPPAPAIARIHTRDSTARSV